MNPKTNPATNAYSQVGLETAVASASPHKLILMLFDGALQAVRAAMGYMEKKKPGPKGENVGRAMDVINELNASLRHDVGGEIAPNLALLYEHMNMRLLQGNLDNNREYLEEVVQILSELREAWAAIGSAEQDAKPNKNKKSQ